MAQSLTSCDAFYVFFFSIRGCVLQPDMVKQPMHLEIISAILAVGLGSLLFVFLEHHTSQDEIE